MKPSRDEPQRVARLSRAFTVSRARNRWASRVLMRSAPADCDLGAPPSCWEGKTIPAMLQRSRLHVDSVKPESRSLECTISADGPHLHELRGADGPSRSTDCAGHD